MSTAHRRRRTAAALGGLAATLASAVALAAPLAPATDDIRDIRGPIAIAPWWRWPLVIGVAALAALAVVLVVRAVRARRARDLSPVERARRALDEARAHARAGRVHAWADIVAETVRGALSARLGLDLLPQTLRELADGAWTKPPLDAELESDRILALLEACDLARFARASLDADALERATAGARDVVERLYAPPERPSAGAALPQRPTVTT
ncbi:MAG TPA: hypothetical protein VGM56_13740 [Byssovorax sp.]|jgi:hypothetical protein|nr:hypothetical protein [Polyangia bacterium]